MRRHAGEPGKEKPYIGLLDPEQWRMPFGKYKGKSLGWIVRNDLLYMDWLVDVAREPLRTSVACLCERYAKEIDVLTDKKNGDL